ncbi:MAG: hypothetical protein HY259_10495 [Chloroflexi bacterium]|nr:hypothetical protein [Chloroflexota bacterium]
MIRAPQGPDPLGVRASAEFVMSQARTVSLDEQAIERVCANFASELPVPAWNHQYHFGDGTPRTANYILLLDALNFSFWGEPRWDLAYRGERLNGYWALAAGLKRAIEEGRDIADAGFLSRMDSATLGHILRGEGVIPLLEQRAAHAREVGAVLCEKYHGQCARLIEAAGFDAPAVAQAVVENFPSFRDEAVYHGRAVKFYKRAQIVAADLFGAFGGRQWGALSRMDTLTCFADYKLPQILRRFGVLGYADALAARVGARREIPAGSDEEIEIRAATIAAVERIRARLNGRGVAVNSVQIDWALWDAAQGTGDEPYHRTRTVFY